MKKLLLKLAYGILNMYKEKPTSIELGNVVIIKGQRFRVTDFIVTNELDRCSSVRIYGRDMLEGLYGRNR